MIFRNVNKDSFELFGNLCSRADEIFIYLFRWLKESFMIQEMPSEPFSSTAFITGA